MRSTSCTFMLTEYSSDDELQGAPSLAHERTLVAGNTVYQYAGAERT
jgi:hypothetical protein